LKYYDGFGKDVTDYVQGLERAVVELNKELLDVLKANEPQSTTVAVEGIGKADLKKAKRKRSRKKVASAT